MRYMELIQQNLGNLVHTLCLTYQYSCSPYLWGETAVSQFRERQSKGWVLCKQAGMTEVLDMVNKNVLKQSVLEFPIDLSLEVWLLNCYNNNTKLFTVAFKQLQ